MPASRPPWPGHHSLRGPTMQLHFARFGCLALMYFHMYIYIYIHTHIYIYVYVQFVCLSHSATTSECVLAANVPNVQSTNVELSQWLWYHIEIWHTNFSIRGFFLSNIVQVELKKSCFRLQHTSEMFFLQKEPPAGMHHTESQSLDAATNCFYQNPDIPISR